MKYDLLLAKQKELFVSLFFLKEKNQVKEVINVNVNVSFVLKNEIKIIEEDRSHFCLI